MYARFLFALIVIALLCYLVGWQELLTALAQLELLDVIKLIALSVALIWVSSVKWSLFLKAAGHQVSVLQLMRLYTIGYFVNTFTPSFVGGDVVRSVQLGRTLSSRRDAFVSTFFERFTGLLAMTSLGLMFVALGSSATAGIEVSITILGLSTLLIAAICFSDSTSTIAFDLSRQLLSRTLPQRFSSKANIFQDQLQEAFAFGRNNPKLLLKAMIWSFTYHALAVLNTYVAAQAVGWQEPDLLGLFVVVPLVLIVSMLPLTPSGLGVQEGAFLFFLQRIGADEGQALGVGVVLRAKTFLIAAIGGLLWLSLKRDSATLKPDQALT